MFEWSAANKARVLSRKTAFEASSSEVEAR
jgi:hypothetical protein